jgi:hypothetical protein
MFKKLLILWVFAGVLSIGVNTFAMNKTDKNVIQVKIASIQGNVVTIKDSQGGVTVLEVRSTAGLSVGAAAWCEQDCNTTMKAGSTVINVQKVIKQRTWGDPHVDGKVVR